LSPAAIAVVPGEINNPVGSPGPKGKGNLIFTSPFTSPSATKDYFSRFTKKTRIKINAQSHVDA